MQQIRNLLDAVSPAHVAPLFMTLVEPIVADGDWPLVPWCQDTCRLPLGS